MSTVYAPMRAKAKNLWSLADRKYLLAQHKLMYIEDIAAKLGRTVTATKSKAQEMGCSIKLTPKGNK